MKECEATNLEDLEVCYSEADRVWKDDCLALCASEAPPRPDAMAGCKVQCRLRYGVELDACSVAIDQAGDACLEKCDTASDDCMSHCSVTTASPQ